MAEPKVGERVIDIACGTGIVSRVSAAKVGPTGTVAGVDFNPGMLAVARALATTDGDASIQWHDATANILPFPDGTFDIAYCQLGLQFFADRGRFARDAQGSVFKGRLALMVWCGINESPGFESLK